MTVKDCSKCGLTKDLAEFNRRSRSPDGRRGDCRACQAVYSKHYNASTGKAAPGICRNCGGPVRRGNSNGVCRSTPECLRLNESLHNRASRAARGQVPPPCKSCGKEYHRRMVPGRNGWLCPACLESKFWCSGPSAVTAHVALLVHRAGAGTCRSCRMLRHARRRAATQGVAFALTWQYVESIFPDACPYLGLPLESGTVHQRASTPSLDRLEPAKGYVEGNIEVISYLANAMKQNATPEQLLAFARAVLRKFGPEVTR